jgi:putative sigma-54 modulation protein
MDITVSSRHLAVSDELRQYVEEKIGKLGKFREMDRAEVHFFEERNPRINAKERCEVTMHGQGHVVRARCAAFEQFAAVDLVVEKLEHQLHKLKTRMVGRYNGKLHRPKDFARTVGDHEVIDEVSEEEVTTNGATPQAEIGPPPKVVKLKQFDMPAMTVDAAIVNLEMVDHGFYVFQDSESGELAVLYRRDDGDLGLIRQAQ